MDERKPFKGFLATFISFRLYLFHASFIECHSYFRYRFPGCFQKNFLYFLYWRCRCHRNCGRLRHRHRLRYLFIAFEIPLMCSSCPSFAREGRFHLWLGVQICCWQVFASVVGGDDDGRRVFGSCGSCLFATAVFQCLSFHSAIWFWLLETRVGNINIDLATLGYSHQHQRHHNRHHQTTNHHVVAHYSRRVNSKRKKNQFGSRLSGT